MAGMYFESQYIVQMKNAANAVTGAAGPAKAKMRRALWLSDMFLRTAVASLLVTLVGAGGLMIAFARHRTARQQGFDVIQ
jgi:anti-sigma-K factor RskA